MTLLLSIEACFQTCILSVLKLHVHTAVLIVQLGRVFAALG